VTLAEALEAIGVYRRIPIRYAEVELEEALKVAGEAGIYAYDAYLIRCAQKYGAPLMTLDKELERVARGMRVDVIECGGEGMRVYTYTEARQRLAELLERAAQEGEVRIRRRDGRVFVVRPERVEGSPLDVEGVDLRLSVEEIVELVREEKRRYR